MSWGLSFLSRAASPAVEDWLGGSLRRRWGASTPASSELVCKAGCSVGDLSVSPQQPLDSASTSRVRIKDVGRTNESTPNLAWIAGQGNRRRYNSGRAADTRVVTTSPKSGKLRGK
jgi:hypothetical protein